MQKYQIFTGIYFLPAQLLLRRLPPAFSIFNLRNRWVLDRQNTSVTHTHTSTTRFTASDTQSASTDFHLSHCLSASSLLFSSYSYSWRRKLTCGNPIRTTLHISLHHQHWTWAHSRHLLEQGTHIFIQHLRPTSTLLTYMFPSLQHARYI